MNCEFEDKIFNITDASFTALTLDIYHYQYQNNTVYRKYVDTLYPVGLTVDSIQKIPFLPISLFKTHTVVTGDFNPVLSFESSGTTGTVNSKHYLKDTDLYRKSFLTTFERFYGRTEDWCVIGLLPSYLERKASSLVYMVNELIQKSGHPQSGFYLYEHEKLAAVLHSLEEKKQKTLLIGVSFGLLDFAESFPMQLKHTVVMETGGMKGRREEITRMQLHQVLRTAWAVSSVHSEYGMTELLSQAYSFSDGLFRCPPWMKVLVREEDDPLSTRLEGAGILNIIDLANIYSCCFIATEDVGRVHGNGSFEVQGRVDNSDLRGCSLLVAGSS
jgi:hypothetical protein